MCKVEICARTCHSVTSTDKDAHYTSKSCYLPLLFVIPPTQYYNHTMTRNPIVSAVVAFGYIVGLVWVMNIITQTTRKPGIMAPLMMICVFTLSAAVMGYLFCLAPLQLYLDGKRQEAVKLFLQTTFTFGIITGLVILLFVSGIASP